MITFKSYKKMKIFLKTERNLFMDSNILKQINSIITSFLDASQMNYMRVINYSTSRLRIF